MSRYQARAIGRCYDIRQNINGEHRYRREIYHPPCLQSESGYVGANQRTADLTAPDLLRYPAPPCSLPLCLTQPADTFIEPRKQSIHFLIFCVGWWAAGNNQKIQPESDRKHMTGGNGWKRPEEQLEKQPKITRATIGNIAITRRFTARYRRISLSGSILMDVSAAEPRHSTQVGGFYDRPYPKCSETRNNIGADTGSPFRVLRQYRPTFCMIPAEQYLRHIQPTPL